MIKFINMKVYEIQSIPRQLQYILQNIRNR